MSRPVSPAELAALKASVVRHYEGRLAHYGPTAQGMDWKDEASQQLRFTVLTEVCDLAGKTVHEIGAGAGHLADFLRARGVATQYSGSDLSTEMVAVARRLHPDTPFERLDVLEAPPPRRYDIVLCSGLFHVKLDHPADVWWRFVADSLRAMWSMCREAIAFNLMSDQVDYRADNLFYAPAGGTLDFCRRALSRFVVLRHDYPLHEYTTYVYRTPPRA